MSSNTQSSESRIEFSLTEIDGIGSSRAETLGESNIADVAKMSVADLSDTLSVNDDEAENIRQQAEEMVDVENESQTAASNGDDDGPGQSFLEFEEPENERENNVLVLTGQWELNDEPVSSQTATVTEGLNELPYGVSKVGAITGGFGYDALKHTLTADDPDDVVPDPVDGTVFDAESEEFGGDVEARNVSALNWADTLLVLTNGDYIGMFILMVTGNQYDVGNVDIISMAEQDEDE